MSRCLGLRPDHGVGRGVALRPRVRQALAGGGVVDGLGDVGRVIADALEVPGDEQQVRARRDVARIVHHVGDQLAEDRRVEVVDHAVRAPDLLGQSGVALADGVDHRLEVPLHHTSHVGQGREAERQRVVRQHDGALDRVRGVVADPIEIAGDLQRRDDLAQVVGDRLAKRQQTNDEPLHLALQFVDLGVEFDRTRRVGGVALRHRLGREADLALRDPAHLEVRVGNVETSDGSRQVFGAVAKAGTDIAVLIRRGLETVGRTAATALTAFTDGCPGLRSILAEAGVTKPPIADWFHIAMRLQHAKQAASRLSTDEPGRIQAKTAIVAEVERLHWRIWHGKARNARRTLERIGKVMHVFKGERGHRTTGVPSRKLWHALREVDNYLRSQSTRLVNYAERYRAGLRVGADLSEWRSDPLRWHRLAPRSAIGDHMPKVTVYKVKLLQRDNG